MKECDNSKTILRHTILGRNSLEKRSARRRDFYLTTHNTHNIHAPGGIGTPNPSKQATADPRLRPRSHWDRQYEVLLTYHKY